MNALSLHGRVHQLWEVQHIHQDRMNASSASLVSIQNAHVQRMCAITVSVSRYGDKLIIMDVKKIK